MSDPLTKELVLVLATAIASEHNGQATFYDLKNDLRKGQSDIALELMWVDVENMLWELFNEKKLIYKGSRRYALPTAA